jgi:hypothetical protein
VWRDVEAFAALDRTSGQAGESQAVDYILAELRAAGIHANVHEFDSYLSYPGPARLRAGASEIECITHSFAAPTTAEGLQAELAWVGDGEAAGYAGQEARGKAVMFGDYKGLVMPERVHRAEAAGAAAVICVNYGEFLHEMIVTTIWGTPTPGDLAKLPRIPVISIRRSDGERLAGELQSGGRVPVELHTQVETGWRRLRIPVADIPGQTPSFFLAAGHLDSWYVGVTDNATGDALLLELARAFAANRALLRRGLRVAWWPGHSTGRYSGSAYYSELAWSELDRHCVGLTIVGSPGVRGATVQRVRTMAEAREFNVRTLHQLGFDKVNVLRPERVGDQSFLGLGITAMSHNSELASGHPDRFPVGGSGGGWWWHNAADTLDKADPVVLESDARTYASLLARFTCDEVLPLDFTAAAAELAAVLTDWHLRSGGRLKCAEVMTRAGRLNAAVAGWQRRVAAGEVEPAEAERVMLDLARAINPVLYTAAGRYGQDPAAAQPLLPGLALAGELPRLDAAGDPTEYRFAQAQLRRELNRIADAVGRALELVTGVEAARE